MPEKCLGKGCSCDLSTSHFITAPEAKQAIESIEEELEERLKELRNEGCLLEAQNWK